MLEALIAFLPVATLLALSPGPATAMVVHAAARGGPRPAVTAMAGNAAGLTVWAVLSMFGVSALVIASQTAWVALKWIAAAILVALGVQALLRARRSHQTGEMRAGRPFRRGIVTALSNPKVALFYVALLPQFVPAQAPMLPATLLLGAEQIVLSLAWYLLLALAVSRVRAAFLRHVHRLEAISGAALIGFGVKLASERR